MNRHDRRRAKATTGWVPMQKAHVVHKTPEQKEAMFAHVKRQFPDVPDADIHQRLAEADSELREVWKNDLYTCWVIRPNEAIIHLSIKRNDRKVVHDWRHLQKIKNDVVGPEHEAVELYPAESRLVDTATQYHLWVWADPKFRVPLGWTTRTVTGEAPPGGDQRPLDEE